MLHIFDILCVLYRLSVDRDTKHNELKEDHKLERACQDLMDREKLWLVEKGSCAQCVTLMLEQRLSSPNAAQAGKLI